MEQPAVRNNMSVAPAIPELNLGDGSSPTVHTSDHNFDQEEQTDDPEIEEEQTRVPQQDLSDYQPAKDRSRRVTRPPSRYAYLDLVFCALVAGYELRDSEPSTYEEAVSSKECTKWQ